MANHGFVTTNKWLTQDKVKEDIEEIISRCFKNKIFLVINGDNSFSIGFEYPWNITCWFENCHKVEFRNPAPDWCWWIMFVIQNELAIKYNGLISDEGTGEEKWKGIPNKYPTFKSYLNGRFSHIKQPAKSALKLINHFLSSTAPRKVKETYKP